MTERLILVVEDEAVMRRVLTLALHSRGYLVAQAETGRQALDRIRAGRPDAMILDLGLPDMDGIEVAEVAHREHQVPIIVLSARGDEQQQIRALDVGADDYVTKPFREGELLRKLERHPLPGWAAEIGCASWAQIILKFIISHPVVTCAIPATTRVDHVRENMAAATGLLPDQAMRARMIARVENF